METLDEALKREHREIDEDIAIFAAGGDDREDQISSLQRAIAGLRRHIYLEETFLFPPLKAAGMMGPIFVMLRDHGQMWRTMDSLELELRNNIADESMRERCTELMAELEAHNFKEEQILYSQADGILNAEASDGLKDFIAEGATPEGWACAQALG